MLPGHLFARISRVGRRKRSCHACMSRDLLAAQCHFKHYSVMLQWPDLDFSLVELYDGLGNGEAQPVAAVGGSCLISTVKSLKYMTEVAVRNLGIIVDNL